MRDVGYWIVILTLVITGIAYAQNNASEQAAQEGYRGVREFRGVLLPLVHQALPQKDYATLISSAMDVKKAAFAYSKMKYETHNHAKDSTFKISRDSLGLLIQEYAAAAERYDTIGVCSLITQAESKFEESAAAISAYRWPEFEKLYATVEPFYDALVTDRAMDAPKPKDGKPKPAPDIPRTVNLISDQMAAWVASPIPKEVEYRAKLIGEEQAYYTKLVEQMKTSSLKGNTAKLVVDLTNLKVRLRNFTRSYLQ